MCNLKLSGLGVAMVTPMNIDGSVNFETLDKLVDYQIEGGADFLLAMGTTGESATLEESERIAIIKAIIKKVDKRVPLIVGVGDNYTKRLLEKIERFTLDGVDGFLSIVPYYNKPNQEGIYRHFCELNKASKLPIILYNIPGRTGVNAKPETIKRIADDCEKIFAVKEAAGSVDQVKQLVDLLGQRLTILSGDDHLTIPFMKVGAKGVISVVGNAYPKYFSQLVAYALNKDWEKAQSMDQRLEQLYQLLFVEGNPGGIKSLLKSMELIPNDTMRLPLTEVSHKTAEQLFEVYQTLGTDH